MVGSLSPFHFSSKEDQVESKQMRSIAVLYMTPCKQIVYFPAVLSWFDDIGKNGMTYNL